MAELSGWGFPMNILRVLARQSLGVHLSWAIPGWILNDPCSRLLVVLQNTLVIASPPGDPR